MLGVWLWFWCIVYCEAVSNIVSEEADVEFSQQDSVPQSKSTYSEQQPNFIAILADDMGWGDMGANWAVTRDTPNLDALAKGGLRLSDFHSAASVCAPSRAALLTARLGLRTGVVRNFPAAALGGLPTNETTFAEMLRAVGYRTAMIGKWHLGMEPGHHPLDKGFDRYLGVPYSVDMGCTDGPAANLPPCRPCPRGPGPRNASAGTDSKHCTDDLALPLFKDRSVLQQPLDLSTLTQHYARFAEDFILARSERAGEAASRPFLLYAAAAHVHVPLATGACFVNASAQGPLGDALRELDWLAGRLAKAAAEARRRPPFRDTLIWFLSDNGPWEVKCSLAGTAGPFTGAWQRAGGGGGGSASKQTVWEGGHRVPAFVHWPSRLPGGRVSDALTSALDVLPTLAALASAPLPSARTLDGLDLTPLLLSPAAPPPRQVLFHPNSGAVGEDGEVGAVRVGRFKVLYYSGGAQACGGASGPPLRLRPPLVFDVQADPADALPLGGERAAWARAAASRALDGLHASLRADNTSTADYAHSPAARPCCNPRSPICRCRWDWRRASSRVCTGEALLHHYSGSKLNL